MGKHTIFFAFVSLLVCGCLTEQERLERAKQEQKQRVQAAKEAAESRLKLRSSKLESYWSDIATHNVMALQDYIKEQVWRYGSCDERKSAELHQMLSHWVSIEGGNVETAEANLEAFGIKYMPNAWAQYEKVRDAAKECQQVFNENFAAVENPKNEGWRNYSAALMGLSKCRTAYLRRRDELIHLFLLHKVGGVSGGDLSAYDCKKRHVWLLEKEDAPSFGLTQFSVKDNNLKKSRHNVSQYIALNGKERDFAAKYLSETFPLVENLENQLQESRQLFLEIVADAKMFSYCRYDLSKIACYEKHEYVSDMLNKTYTTIRELRIKHQMMSIDIDRLTSLDKSMSANLMKFSSVAKDYISKRSAGPVFDVGSEMARFFPAKNYVCVWQFQALGFYLSPCYNYEDIADVRYPMYTRSDEMTCYSPVSVGCSRKQKYGVDIDRAVYRNILNKDLMKYAVNPSSYQPKDHDLRWCDKRIYTPKDASGRYGYLSERDDNYESCIRAKMMGSVPYLCSVINAEALVKPLCIGFLANNGRYIAEFSCDWSEPMLSIRALEIDNVLYRFEIEEQGHRGGEHRIKVMKVE